MITFKQFLAEGTPYYSSYDTLRSSKSAIKRFTQRISEKFGIPSARIKIEPFLESTKPVFRFVFKITLGKKDDPELVGRLMLDFCKKDLENDYPKVTVHDEPETWQFSHKPIRTVFSLETEGNQK